MGYINKPAILKAYEVLSHLSENHMQGATQKVSAIRHFMALDSFYKKFQRDCNTREADDKKEFSEEVGVICSICPNYYTTNFYMPLKEHNGDFNVGSNFYSAGQVKASLVNGAQKFSYPKRSGQPPLFDIKNGTLIRNIAYYQNFKNYIASTDAKVAIVIWVLRNIVIENSSNLYESLQNAFKHVFTEELTSLLFSDRDEFKYVLDTYNLSLQDKPCFIDERDIVSVFNVQMNDIKSSVIDKKQSPFITSLHTKPFLLLAGISGTGKSQKVQELAFMTCTKELREEGKTMPGNYCLVEVKPNWHDSTELLGFYSALTGKYELTDFIRFVYKATQHRDVPFFLCLDEMNLAPVEQYFAEYLSILETRKRIYEKITSQPSPNIEGKLTVNKSEHIEIVSQPLLSKDRFANCSLNRKEKLKKTGYTIDGQDEYETKELYSPKDAEIISYLKENGLSLPDNLFVIGTVNMDDTTHQFSRKVIDRAFTIEMNGGRMEDMFSEESKTLLEYRDEPVPLDMFKSEFVRANEVLDDERFARYADVIKKEIPALLGNSDGTADEDSINGILNGTPFRVSYRVQNELVLYLSVLIEQANFPDDITNLIGEATLAILLEKVLPRVQGEQKQLETKSGQSNLLKDLKAFVESHFAPQEGADSTLFNNVISKLNEMDKKLESYYTNFF